MSIKTFILDALTGSPAKGFTPAELAREHQAQMIGVIDVSDLVASARERNLFKRNGAALDETKEQNLRL